mmetsp:Transcript_21107/g.50937  ORF Transcript_21107/g.50937 Transcript_21107/m.50937 type:complete len:548 (+) Transcript_21107:296-1939(+)
MTIIYISRENILQWAFALSPFPAYLPQYFAMMQQLVRSPAENDDAAALGGNDDSEKGAKSNNGSVITAMQQQQHLRKRHFLDYQSQPSMNGKTIIDTNTTASTHSPNFDFDGGALPAPSKPSSPYGQSVIGSQKNDEDGNDRHTDDKSGTGLSRATVLLLLSAHLLRLLYFHGLLLEESQPLLPIASAGKDYLIAPSPPAVAEASVLPEHPSALQWDLLGQSLSMIVVQIMLLHAMMLIRRRQLTKISRIRRTSDGGLDRENSHGSTDSLLASSLSSSSTIIASAELSSPSPPHGTHVNHGYNNNSSLPVASGGIINNSNNASSCWRTTWRHFSNIVTSHFHHLLSPHNILQTHTFFEYLELIFLTSMAVKLVFDYRWYPQYRMLVVDRLKHASIVLESCLALPQAIRNYRKGTTKGLSVVMVGGWVAGDLFKLCYFMISMIEGEGDNSGNSNGVGVFALGCILAILLDSIVAIQMAWWYPQPETSKWQERIMRSVRHWKTNKDDDAGESLLLSSSEKKNGLAASFLRSCFQWARGIRPPSNNASSP